MLRSGPITRKLRLGKTAKAKPVPAKQRPKIYASVGAVIVKPDGREVCSDTALGRAEYKARLDTLIQRQHSLCALCGLPFNRFSDLLCAVFCHGRPRGAGGAWRDDRIEVDGKWNNAAGHAKCNTEQGSKHYHWNEEGRFVPVERSAA